MTSMSTTAPVTHRESWFSRTERWLDDKGKGAWIAAMVFGFILFWPIGLALLVLYDLEQTHVLEILQLPAV